MSGRAKILYAVLVVGCPWLKARLATLLRYVGLTRLENQVRREYFQRTKLLNFLIVQLSVGKCTA